MHNNIYILIQTVNDIKQQISDLYDKILYKVNINLKKESYFQRVIRKVIHSFSPNFIKQSPTTTTNENHEINFDEIFINLETIYDNLDNIDNIDSKFNLKLLKIIQEAAATSTTTSTPTPPTTTTTPTPTTSTTTTATTATTTAKAAAKEAAAKAKETATLEKEANLSFDKFNDTINELSLSLLKAKSNTTIEALKALKALKAKAGEKTFEEKKALKAAAKETATLEKAANLSFDKFNNSINKLSLSLLRALDKTELESTKKGGNTIEHSYIDYTINDSTRMRINNLVFYNIIKFIRYKYYTKNINSLNIHSIIFKDYFITLILSILLFILKMEKLSFGIIIDQVLSIGMFYKYKDHNYLLLPYYIAFL